jgi:hypothetical protein
VNERETKKKTPVSVGEEIRKERKSNAELADCMASKDAPGDFSTGKLPLTGFLLLLRLLPPNQSARWMVIFKHTRAFPPS